MTDRQKVKHAIEVLKVIEERLDNLSDGQYIMQNVMDLRELLSKPHVKTKGDTKEVTHDAARLSERLYHHIKERKPNYRPPNWLVWGQDMDKIIRLDNRTVGQLEEVIDWCQQDSFWQNNILSPATLRKQLDRLELQMSKDWHWQKMKLHRKMKRTGLTAKEVYMESLNEKDSGEHE